MTEQLDTHLPWIKGELAASPAATLAVSLDQLGHTAASHEIGVDLVREFAREIDLEAIGGQLAKDIGLLREAQDILEHRTPILGMSYFNFSLNIRDCGWNLSDFAHVRLAREVIARVTAAEPRLGRIILERPALVPF